MQRHIACQALATFKFAVRQPNRNRYDNYQFVHNITKKADEKYISSFIRFLKYVNLLSATSNFVDTVCVASTFEVRCHKC